MRSQDWLRRQAKDPFVRQARQDGFRSRATYKLAELDQRCRLFRPGMQVLDLGAAPGGFSQYAVQRVIPGGRVWAVDLLPMAPITGVELLQADLATEDGLAAVMAWVGQGGIHALISDMAPGLSGDAARDQAAWLAMAEGAVTLARQLLLPGGVFLVKAFAGSELKTFEAMMREACPTMQRIKPKASRSESRELYLVGWRAGDSGARNRRAQKQSMINE
jgi:23S rRNA (uridine2552-2'-O)-methyltransferase